MAGCGEGSFFIGLDFRIGSTFEQAGLYVFNVSRISCLDVLITMTQVLDVNAPEYDFSAMNTKIHSTHTYMLMLMSRPSSLAHKLMLMLVLMLSSLVRTRL